MIGNGESKLRAYLSVELAQPVAPAVMAVADAVLARHPKGVAGIVFYGACLREEVIADHLIDFYLIVDSFTEIYTSPLARMGNWMVPPNVYYLETAFEGRTVRAKYAVVSNRQLAGQTSRRSHHATLWGRMSQPCRLVYVRDDDARTRFETCFVSALRTFYHATLPLMLGEFSAEAFWQEGLRRSYRTEFRAERSGRQASLYAPFAERFGQVLGLLAKEDDGVVAAGPLTWRHTPSRAARAFAKTRWLERRVVGRFLQVFRLGKAAFTFANGLDYILYKIEKHSGERVEATDWQRRHPLLAAPGLAWRLYWRGGFR